MNSSKSDKSGLPVAVDAMGGDLGSTEIVKGVVDAVKKHNIQAIIVGKEEEIEASLKKFGAQKNSNISIQHASQVITMEDSPSRALRKKSDASMKVAFELVKQKKACGVVSPGNTGAMMAAGLFISGTLEGINRPAIATLIPRVGQPYPTVLLDSGANIDCNAHQLVQFALMGSFYSSSALSSKAPKVGILSNGTEKTKGNDVIRAAHVLLEKNSEINYVGLVEGRQLATPKVDVVVCDGFIGNVVLKTMEGAVEMVVESIKFMTEKSTRSRIGMALARPMFRKIFKNKLDPAAFGGAPLLGLNDIAIVCHGHSKARAITNAMSVAKKLEAADLINKMRGSLEGLNVLDSMSEQGDFEDKIWDRIGIKFNKGNEQ